MIASPSGVGSNWDEAMGRYDLNMIIMVFIMKSWSSQNHDDHKMIIKSSSSSARVGSGPSETKQWADMIAKPKQAAVVWHRWSWWWRWWWCWWWWWSSQFSIDWSKCHHIRVDGAQSIWRQGCSQPTFHQLTAIDWSPILCFSATPSLPRQQS